MLKIGDEVYVHGYIQEVFKYDICKVLSACERLESEYEAYHTDNDYWRGVRYALDVIGGNQTW